MQFKGFKRHNAIPLKGRSDGRRKRIPWGKYAYLLFLMFILVSLTKWGTRRLFFVEGLGVLDAERINVEGNLTGRVIKIKCELNDRIADGAPLVVLSQPELEHEFANKEVELNNELKLLQKERENQLTETKVLRESHRRAKKLLSLEAITLSRFLEVQSDLNRSEQELSLLQTRAALTEKKLEALKREYYEGVNGTPGNDHNGNHLKETVLYAPTSGLVTLIYKREGEVTRVGEPVLEIADLSSTFIKAYFEGSVENEIIVGEEVSILFENGDKTTGRIRKVYRAALPLPVEFLKQYERQERYILAEIVPIDGSRWPGILKTRARVRLRRSWL